MTPGPGILLGAWLALAASALHADSGRRIHEETLPRGDRLIVVEDHRVPVVHLRVVVPIGTLSPWWRREQRSVLPWTGQTWYVEDEPWRELRTLGVEVDFDVDAKASTLDVAYLTDDDLNVIGLLSGVLSGMPVDGIVDVNWERSLWWHRVSVDPSFILHRTVTEALFASDDPRVTAWTYTPEPQTTATGLARRRDALLTATPRILGAAGDITPADARTAFALLLPAAGPRTPRDLAIPPPRLRPPAERTSRSVVPVAGIDHALVAFARPTAPDSTAGLAAFMVADHVLCNSYHSRLLNALRHRDADTYAVVSEGGPTDTQSTYVVSTWAPVDRADEVEATIRTEIARMHDQGVTASERDGAADSLAGNLANYRESPVTDLILRMSEAQGGREGTWRDDLMRIVRDMDLGEMNEAIRAFYDPDEFISVRLEPKAAPSGRR